MRGQRVAALLRTISSRCHGPQQAPWAAAAGALQGSRPFSSPPAGPSVPPAATSVEITDEWYNRQRQTIPLGNRVPDTAMSVYMAPRATSVGDVDLLERVGPWDRALALQPPCWAPGTRRASCAHVGAALVLAGAAPRLLPQEPSLPAHISTSWSKCERRFVCTPRCPHAQASIWNHVVLRGDLNNITVGQVSNIQDRTVVHAARCVLRRGADPRYPPDAPCRPSCRRTPRCAHVCGVWPTPQSHTLPPLSAGRRPRASRRPC